MTPITAYDLFFPAGTREVKERCHLSLTYCRLRFTVSPHVNRQVSPEDNDDILLEHGLLHLRVKYSSIVLYGYSRQVFFTIYILFIGIHYILFIGIRPRRRRRPG
jgi:hypothetical protein